MRYTLWPILIVGLSILPGCNEEEPAPEAEARRGIEAFTDATEAMEQEAEDLTKEVDALQQQLRESLDKHLALLDTRLSGYEERIVRLPAEREAEFRQHYSRLIAQTGEVKQLFQQWVQASDEQTDALRQRLNEARAQLDEAFEQFEARLTEAESQAG